VSASSESISGFLLGGFIGFWSLVVVAAIWSRIDLWWFQKGRTRYRHWRLGLMKPLIVQRWRGVYGLPFSEKTYWCISRDIRPPRDTMYRAGNARSPEIAYARWRHSPKFWSGSHPVLKWQ
jgi:hypothetical protein